MSGYDLPDRSAPPPHPDDAGARIVCPQCGTENSVRVVLQGACCEMAAMREKALRQQRGGRRGSRGGAYGGPGGTGKKRRGPAPSPAERESARRRARSAARDAGLLRGNVFFPARVSPRFRTQRMNELSVPSQSRKTAKVVTSGFAKSELELLLLEKANVPGPDAYDLPAALCEMRGGQFSTANPKTALDWACYNAARQPGPGAHTLPDFTAGMSGGRFSLGNQKSPTQRLCDEAALKPGPGAYALPDLTSSPKPGGRFGAGAKPKSDVDWAILRGRGQPGPGDCQPRVGFGECGPVTSPVRGGLFLGANSKSSLDMLLEEARHMPGPGRYEAEGRGRMGCVNLAGARSKTALEALLIEAEKVPGPGAYSPHRQEPILGGAFSHGLHSEDASTASPGPAVYQLPGLTGTEASGGKFSDAVPKSELDWAILRAAKQPGPADYTLNSSFTVVEVSPIKCRRAKLPQI